MRFHSVTKEAKREHGEKCLHMPLWGNMWANAAGKCRQDQLIALPC